MVGPDTPRLQGTKDLIEGVVERIRRCRMFSELRLCVYDEMERFGLLIIATSEGLFNSTLWKENDRNKIIEMVRMFLRKHV